MLMIQERWRGLVIFMRFHIMLLKLWILGLLLLMLATGPVLRGTMRW
jgi:hypothetical protein